MSGVECENKDFKYKVGERVMRNNEPAPEDRPALSRPGWVGTIIGIRDDRAWERSYIIKWDCKKVTIGTLESLIEKYEDYSTFRKYYYPTFQYWDEAVETPPLTLNKNKSMVKKLSNWIKRTVNEDTQKLIKAGMLNGDLEPTEAGWDILEEIQWEKNHTDLVKRADEIIAEAEKSDIK